MRPVLVTTTAALLALGTLGSVPANAGAGSGEGRRATVAPRAAASTTIGQVGTGVCNITAPAGFVINSQGAGAPTYVAPTDGVLTSFSHQANNRAGQVQAIVFADGPTATQKTVVVKSTKQTVTVNQLNTFATRLPIKAGQRLGLGYTVNGMACATSGVAGDTTLVKSPFDPDATSTFVADGLLSNPPNTFRPNISAVLEPDADGDGYGDLSQDGCPQSAHVTAACPDTSITKKPKHKTAHPKVKIKVEFTASITGSTFECRLDGHKKWRPCSSPYKLMLGAGRHTLQVRAVSPAGVPDPKPARTRFTIRRG